MKASVEQTNKYLRAAMEGVATADEWLKVTGVSLDDLFSLDGRIEVTIDAKQAKKLGLVNKIVSITPQKKAEIESHVMALAAHYIPKEAAAPAPPPPTPPTPQSKNTPMTLAELQAQHPDLYAAAVKAGQTAERERVKGFLAFSAIDPEGVAKAIKDGDELTMSVIAEYSQKAASKAHLGKIEKDSAPGVQTEEAGEQPTADALALKAFNDAVKSNLKNNGYAVA
jgi:enoyl-CoA hydratase/carnithine racemase